MEDLIHKPIKLLLVDDEDKVRRLLRLCLSWEDVGYEIVGEASSAEQALELIPLLTPDLILTDIEMPLLNGLDFAQMLMQEYPHMKVVILTAHDVFQYAKKGVEIGVCAFIVKPVKKEELRAAMENVRDAIHLERKGIYELSSLKKQLADNKEYILKNQLNNLLLNRIPQERLDDMLKHYQIPLRIDGGHYNVCLLAPEAKEKEALDVLTPIQCERLLSTTIQRIPGILLFTDLQQNLVLLCENPKINLDAYATYFASQIREKLNVPVYWGVGVEVTSLTDIRHSYRHAFQMLRAFRESPNETYVSTGKPDGLRNWFPNAVQNILDDLPIALQIPSEEKATALIQTAYGQKKRLQAVPFSEVVISSMTIVNVILSTLRENGIPYDEIYHTEHLPYVHILKMKDAEEIRDYMLNLISFTVQQIERYADNKRNKLVQAIITYVNENIDQSNLSLKKISEWHYANPSYVSRIFKEVTKVTFMDYLNGLRIQKAKKLLKGTNLKIYEIAERVGIADANYFSKFFKKHTGCTPAHYKELAMAKKGNEEDGSVGSK